MRRLMEYKIISGRTVEIRRSWFPVGPAYRKPRGTRRAGASTEKKIKANERSCVMNCARTVNCNFETGDWFVAFKYDDAHYPAGTASDPEERREEEYQACKKLFTKKFLPALRKEYAKQTGKELKAVWVTANWSTKRKHFCRIHHHAVIPADAFGIAEKLWRKHGGAGGTVQGETLTNEGDYTRLAAYMVDNVQGRPSGENRWSACRNMAKPIYTEQVEVSDIEDVQAEYQSVIKEHRTCQDEDGRTVSAYLRCVLKEKARRRGNQIILPKRGRRRE